MKIEKKVLSEVLRVLGKVARQTSPEAVQRSIRFVALAGNVRAVAMDGIEVVSLKVETECTGEIDSSVELGQLRKIARSAKGEIELDGAKLEWPGIEVVPAEALTIEFSKDFCEMHLYRDGERGMLHWIGPRKMSKWPETASAFPDNEWDFRSHPKDFRSVRNNAFQAKLEWEQDPTPG